METSLAVAVCLMIAGVLALELRISTAILEIAAGVILVTFLPHVSELKWLDFLASFGMLALLFVAGFEVEIDKLRRTWRSCLAIGLLSFAVPLGGIYALCALVIGLPPMTSGLVAIGLSTTSLALVYQALRQEDILSTSEGQVILAAASVVDVLSMVSLAMLLGDITWATGVVILVVVLSIFSLPPIGSWLFRRYMGSTAEPEIRFLLVILVAMGFMAENVGGIHPAIVAFAVGVAMAGVVFENTAVKEKMKGLVFGFFAPVFFIHAGTQIDLASLSAEFFVLAGILFAGAVGLKFLGTALPARFLMRDSSARSIGILFNYRLSFGIIAANVGLESGLLTENLYAVMLLIVAGSAALPTLMGASTRRKAVDPFQY
ncbi:cation:proton antiporter [Ectothiorhodospiraceae bacterium WFHF3C12]|nr:cation:proton antiporter [Ectothiorhodospiraceae bacterium WFHF3C12]